MEEIAVVIVTNVDVPVFFVCSVIHSKSLAKQQVAIFSEDEKNKISQRFQYPADRRIGYHDQCSDMHSSSSQFIYGYCFECK